jgi:hypothetical protein
MSFLTPLFFVGLAALAIPILIHLIQRERKQVVAFPSLMFLRRIPYQSVRRRHIRNWALLMLRLAALLLIVAAFARPFLRRPDVPAAAVSGAREVVVLLDNSYSMGYGDRWTRAVAAARDAVNGLGPADRGSVVLFAVDPEVSLRSTGDRGRLLAAISAAEPTAGATRFGPALKLAGSILGESSLPRREAILVSDFQLGGWKGTDGVRLPAGAVLTPVSVAEGGEAANAAVTPVSLQRSTFSNQERITVTAGVINRGNRAISDLAIALDIGGRVVQTERRNVDAHASASVTFAPLTLDSRNMRATIRIADDALARDNAFHFVTSPAESVRALVVHRPGDRASSSLYLTRALSIGEEPKYDVVLESADAFSADDLQRASVVVLNDISVTPGMADSLGRFVENGGGLFVVLGERAAWPSTRDLLPGTPAAFVDRSSKEAGRLGALEYGHPIFELFKAPRSGDFSAARFYGYRALAAGPSAPAPTPPSAPAPKPGASPAPIQQVANQAPQILARFDDGAPALLERRVGRGRVLVWTSTLDLVWNDLAVKPVFLPFVHRIARYLADYSEPPPWLTIGQVLEPPRAGPGSAELTRVALTPSGRRVPIDGEGPDVLELSEQGFYEIRGQANDSVVTAVIASNVDLAESDLTTVDPKEVVAAAAGESGGGAGAGSGEPLTPEAQERSQRIWWYLLFAGILILAAETVLSHKLSRTV